MGRGAKNGIQNFVECSPRRLTARIPRTGFFFFNYPAPTDIYTLSLHDALPISPPCQTIGPAIGLSMKARVMGIKASRGRSEEHTSELQSQSNIVCRLLLEK